MAEGGSVGVREGACVTRPCLFEHEMKVSSRHSLKRFLIRRITLDAWSAQGLTLAHWSILMMMMMMNMIHIFLHT